MTYQRHVIFFFVFFLIAKEVSSWTIDLPEVRRYLFEKNEKYKTAPHHEGKTEYEDYITNDKRYYSNIQGNSMHNSDDRELHGDGNHEDHDKYADKYGYHDYMEKKVHSIVRDGSVYLEGLLGSLELYTRFLQDCNRRDPSYQNQSFWRPQYDFPSSANFTNSSATVQNFNSSNPPMMSNLTQNSMNNNQSSMNQNNNTNNQTFMGMNQTFMGMNQTFMGMNRTFMGMNRTSMSNGNYMRNYNMSCREAMNTSEQVRRYADLAMWATKRLQDLAYAKKYQQIDEREENELILKLAWFLDRLAYLTGFEPQPKLFLQQTRYTTTSPTTSPVPITMVPSSPEQNQAYADCIRQESPIPATVRCQYMGAVPEPVQQVLDSLGTTTSTSPPSTEGFNAVGMSQDNVPSQTLELLITSDNTYPVSSTRTKRSPAEHEVHYPPDIKSKLANPHAIAEFIKKNIGKLKTVVKTVKSLKETTYKALLEEKDHHHHHHEFSYGSIPYLTIHKRSIDNTNSINNNDIPNPKNPNNINITVTDILTDKNERNEQSDDVKLVTRDNSVIKNENNDIPFITGITESSYNHLPIIDAPVINNKSLKKRSIDNTVTWNHIRKIPVFKNYNRKKNIKKRAANDPFSTLANYYIKYKVWDSANPRNSNKNDLFMKKIDRIDVQNNLNDVVKRKKRALFSKQSIHIHLPKPIEHPHVHHEVSHKAKFLTHLHKIQQIAHKKIEKIHDLSHKKLEKTHAINHVKKELEHHMHKRSLHYQDLYLPRISENPQQDISFLVKNREGTNYNPSMTQAAEVRGGLEQAFSTGNILVIRRYGSNYNPANPNPFMAGIIKTMSDA